MWIKATSLAIYTHPSAGWAARARLTAFLRHARWQYVVNEMHWAFAAKLRGDADADPVPERFGGSQS